MLYISTWDPDRVFEDWENIPYFDVSPLQAGQESWSSKIKKLVILSAKILDNMQRVDLKAPDAHTSAKVIFLTTLRAMPGTYVPYSDMDPLKADYEFNLKSSMEEQARARVAAELKVKAARISELSTSIFSIIKKDFQARADFEVAAGENADSFDPLDLQYLGKDVIDTILGSVSVGYKKNKALKALGELLQLIDM